MEARRWSNLVCCPDLRPQQFLVSLIQFLLQQLPFLRVSVADQLWTEPLPIHHTQIQAWDTASNGGFHIGAAATRIKKCWHIGVASRAALCSRQQNYPCIFFVGFTTASKIGLEQ